MAMFRKFLSNTKNKIKVPNIRIKSDGAGPSTSVDNRKSEDLEKKKAEWQSELEEMSEFLVLKSAQEQIDEGKDKPIDTALVEDKDGLPVLTIRFDVGPFPLEDVNVCVHKDQLYIDAQTTESREERVYKKTLLRKIDIPQHVDPRNTKCDVSKSGIMTVEMPLFLSPQRKPQGPNVFPIIDDANGRRHLRLVMAIGPDFSSDDISVETNGHKLCIKARYDAEIGKYGQLVNAREFNREYMLPDYIEIDTVTTVLAPDGRLFVDLLLKDEMPFRCQITSEEVTN